MQCTPLYRLSEDPRSSDCSERYDDKNHITGTILLSISLLFLFMFTVNIYKYKILSNTAYLLYNSRKYCYYNILNVIIICNAK